MSIFGKIVSTSWLLLGIGLTADGIMDVLAWADDLADYATLNWWFSTNITTGILSVTLGICLVRFPKAAKYLGYALSVIFSLYVLYILALTPSGYRVSPMLALQLLVLTLSTATIVLLWKGSEKIESE